MTILGALQLRPPTGPCGADLARDAVTLQRTRQLHDMRRAREEGRPRYLGKLQVIPDEGKTATPDLLDQPSAFWAAAWEGRRRNGGEGLSEEDREGQSRAHRGVSVRALRRPLKEGEHRRNVGVLRDRYRATHPLQRCASCGWSAIGAVGVCKREDGRLVLGSIASCASVWGCPVCASLIKGVRAEEIKEGAQLHDQHYGPQARALGTFTIRHAKGQSLRKLADGFQRAWNHFLTRVPTADKAWRASARRTQRPVPPTLLERLGFLGFVSGAEVTFGENGWHYHRHPLLFFSGALSDAELEHEREEMALWWAECVEKHMGPEHAPTLEQGVRLSRGKADYLAKLGLEVADVGTKRAKCGNFTPWGLGDEAAQGSGKALDAWIEYCEGTKGKKCVQMSDRLRAHWLRLGWKPAAEDGELVDESKGARLLLEVTTDQWKLWRQSARVVADLGEGLEHVRGVLAVYRASLDPGGWGDGQRALDDELDALAKAERYAIQCESGVRAPTRAQTRKKKLDELAAWKASCDTQLIGKEIRYERHSEHGEFDWPSRVSRDQRENSGRESGDGELERGDALARVQVSFSFADTESEGDRQRAISLAKRLTLLRDLDRQGR